MSSDIIARSQTLREKAVELWRKGHLLRAAENYGRAAEAARALGEDNIVTLANQLRQGSSVFANVGALANLQGCAGADDLQIFAAQLSEATALLSGVVAALERRRVAGTLLDGKCTAAEEAWRVREYHRLDQTITADDAASLAALCGYELFLHSAGEVLSVLGHAAMLAVKCSKAQLYCFTQHVLRAAELMQQPRRHGGTAMVMESTFAVSLRDTLANAVEFGLHAYLAQLLESAWNQLQSSGVLESRHIDRRHVWDMVDATIARNYNAALQSSLTAPDRRTCALPGCGAREAHPAHFKSCAACRMVVYCCREHQVEGLPSHKKECKAARKAAAAADADEAGPSGA